MSIRKKPFTLLELSAAMAVLMIFMMFVMRFYNASQDVMNRSTGKTDQYERARIVMDLLASDLQNIYYTEGLKERVYHQKDDSGNTEKLSFRVFRTLTTGNKTSSLALVTYEFDPTEYTLKLGVAGEDQAGSKWDEAEHLTNTDDFGVLAEGVVKFKVTPYSVTDTDVSLDTLKKKKAEVSLGEARIPGYVRVELELMDGESTEAFKNAKKVGMEITADNSPMNPAGDNFIGKDKIRVFSREINLER